MRRVFVLLLLAPACTHVVWRQDGAVQQQLTTDIYECDRDAMASGEERDRIRPVDGPIFTACMIERRWRPVEVDGYRASHWRQYDLDGK